MPVKSVVINSDDFGLSEAVNKGIEECFNGGVLTSTTLLANGPAFDDAVARVKRNPNIAVGAHLNIIRGRPVSQSLKVESLLNKEGFFVGNIKELALRLFKRKIKIIELERELSLQIEKILEAGVKITHIDSEKHCHCLPPVFGIVVKLARKYNINKVRVINERILDNGKFYKSILKPQYYKMVFLNRLFIINRAGFKDGDVKFPDGFFGVLHSGAMTKEIYKKIIPHLKNGVTEIMCHAGYNVYDKEVIRLFGKFYLNSRREDELSALLDPELKKIFNEAGVKLINYGDME